MLTLTRWSDSRLVRNVLLSASLMAMGHTLGSAVCLTFLSGRGDDTSC